MQTALYIYINIRGRGSLNRHTFIQTYIYSPQAQAHKNRLTHTHTHTLDAAITCTVGQTLNVPDLGRQRQRRQSANVGLAAHMRYDCAATVTVVRCLEQSTNHIEHTTSTESVCVCVCVIAFYRLSCAKGSLSLFLENRRATTQQLQTSTNLKCVLSFELHTIQATRKKIIAHFTEHSRTYIQNTLNRGV